MITDYLEVLRKNLNRYLEVLKNFLTSEAMCYVWSFVLLLFVVGFIRGVCYLYDVYREE